MSVWYLLKADYTYGDPVRNVFVARVSFVWHMGLGWPSKASLSQNNVRAGAGGSCKDTHKAIQRTRGNVPTGNASCKLSDRARQTTLWQLTADVSLYLPDAMP